MTITNQEEKENVQDGTTAMQSPVFPSALPLPPIAIPALVTPTFVQGSSIRLTPLLSTLVARAEEYALINKDIHEAINRAASDPMDTDPLEYTATVAAVTQGQPLDSPWVQSENPAEDPSITEEATTMINLFADFPVTQPQPTPGTSQVRGDDLNRYHDEYLLGIPADGEGGSSEWMQTQCNVALLQMVRNVISSIPHLSPAAELGVSHEQVLSLPPETLAFH
ncbi:hypothetical protein V8D89_002301 [Ganoderma adspersum]